MTVNIVPSLEIERPHKVDGKFTPEDEGERIRGLDLLGKINELLDEYDSRRTFFVLGRYLDQAVESLGEERIRAALLPTRTDVEIGQETYTHPPIAPLKTRTELIAISPEEFRQELRRARSSIEKHLRTTPKSLRMPYGFYQGLDSHPEYLRVVGEEGIIHVRADARSADDLFDTFLDGEQGKLRQPSRYPNGVIEVPLNAPQDTAFTGESRTAGTEKYPRTPDKVLELYRGVLSQALQAAERRPITISFDTHLHAMPKYDPNLDVLRGVMEFCKSEGIGTLKYNEVVPN